MDDLSERLLITLIAVKNLVFVLVRVSIVVKRHCDCGKSYKRKYLVGVALPQFRSSSLYHHGGTWQQAGSSGAGEVAASLTSCRQ